MKLDVQSLSVTLGDTTIVKEASFAIDRGEFVGIIGPNGSGKTTLLKALRGLYPTSGGDVLWDGKSISSLSDKEIAHHVAYMQEQEGPEDKVIVENAMKEVGVYHLRHRSVQSLSGGERQRVFLAKALAQQTEVLLLDEPTAALDLVYADDIFHEGRRLCDEGKTILIVVHDLELAAKYCTKLVLVSDGHIVDVGAPRDVLTAENLRNAFRLSAAVYDDPYFKQQRIFVFPKGTTKIDDFKQTEVTSEMSIDPNLK
ncbi:MAG: ABC transporter ATP-binding protein [Veillonella parvula]|nr:ABC transporter ATP-binding protein [Veillonella parvula]